MIFSVAGLVKRIINPQQKPKEKKRYKKRFEGPRQKPSDGNLKSTLCLNQSLHYITFQLIPYNACWLICHLKGQLVK